MARLKMLKEQREELRKALDGIIKKAEDEKRALSDDEVAAFDEAEKSIKAIDVTIALEERCRNIPAVNVDADSNADGKGKTEDKSADEVRAFVAFLQNNQEELRANSAGVSYSGNTGIVPTTIANKIIEKVKELSPIYALVEKFYTKGVLEIPVYGVDEGADGVTGDVNVAYQGDEFTALTAGQGKFTTVELKGYSQGSLSLISNKMINNTDIDVTSFIITQMAKAFAEFWEKELLVGTGEANGHMTGAIHTTNLLYTGTTYTAKAVATAENFIDLQLKVPQQYQANACWIMDKDVFAEARKLKDSNGNFYLAYGRGLNGGMGWELLGKPVYISESMEKATATGKTPVLYGDFAGMAMKLTKELTIQVLREKYSDRNAVGIIGWAETDSKVQNAQMIAAMRTGAAA